MESVMIGDKNSDVYSALQGIKFVQPINLSVRRFFDDVQKVVSTNNHPALNISDHRKVLLDYASKFHRLHSSIKGVYILPHATSSNIFSSLISVDDEEVDQQELNDNFSSCKESSRSSYSSSSISLTSSSLSLKKRSADFLDIIKDPFRSNEDKEAASSEFQTAFERETEVALYAIEEKHHKLVKIEQANFNASRSREYADKLSEALNF
jgi:hypothetical protein